MHAHLPDMKAGTLLLQRRQSRHGQLLGRRIRRRLRHVRCRRGYRPVNTLWCNHDTACLHPAIDADTGRCRQIQQRRPWLIEQNCCTPMPIDMQQSRLTLCRGKHEFSRV